MPVKCRGGLRTSRLISIKLSLGQKNRPLLRWHFHNLGYGLFHGLAMFREVVKQHCAHRRKNGYQSGDHDDQQINGIQKMLFFPGVRWHKSPQNGANTSQTPFSLVFAEPQRDVINEMYQSIELRSS